MCMGNCCAFLLSLLYCMSHQAFSCQNTVEFKISQDTCRLCRIGKPNEEMKQSSERNLFVFLRPHATAFLNDVNFLIHASRRPVALFQRAKKESHEQVVQMVNSTYLQCSHALSSVPGT